MPKLIGPATQGWWKWLVWSAIVVALDQLTKQVITAHFHYGEVKFITSWFNLVLAHNTGAAFSFLANAGGWQRGFFVTVTIVITGVLLWMLRDHKGNRWLALALALVIGGAIGNLIDRVLYGYVVDFVQWHAAGYYWPAFNVADSAISLGAVMLVIDSFRKRTESDRP
ncbi:MAG: lipoprotein signal peptidase [Betaproteobacteria bacterium]|nr:lipoprotein signal peptidase [Betaproteobacteria bacterium]